MCDLARLCHMAVWIEEVLTACLPLHASPERGVCEMQGNPLHGRNVQGTVTLAEDLAKEQQCSPENLYTQRPIRKGPH